jgi:hypothetical protein
MTKRKFEVPPSMEARYLTESGVAGSRPTQSHASRLTQSHASRPTQSHASRPSFARLRIAGEARQRAQPRAPDKVNALGQLGRGRSRCRSHH